MIRQPPKDRVVTDLRRINKKTLKVPCCLNNFRDLIGVLNKSKWFSVLDLKAAYHQIGVTPDTSRKFGIYEYIFQIFVKYLYIPDFREVSVIWEISTSRRYHLARSMHLSFFPNSSLIYYQEMEGYFPTWTISYFTMIT